MKKVLAFALALVLCLSFATFAHAEQGYQGFNPSSEIIEEQNRVESIPVTVSYGPYDSGEPSYGVIITWEDMEFVYEYPTIWDPASQTYSVPELAEGETLQGRWAYEEANAEYFPPCITVENTSNAEIEASFGFKKEESELSIEGWFFTPDNITDQSTINRVLQKHVGTLSPDEQANYVADTAVVHFYVTGTPAAFKEATTIPANTGPVKVGTITVTIDAVLPQS